MTQRPSALGFVIDTEQFAGNFERELCAYVTGHVGECNVGVDDAAAYAEETGKDPLDFVASRPTGDHGVLRPCEIYPTPGWFNHGMGGEFREGDEDRALAHYRKAVSDYWSERRNQRLVDEANALTVVRKFPAYLSVVIFLDREPTPEEVEFMKARALGFSEHRLKSPYEWERRPITVTGFRLVSKLVAA